MLAQTLHTLEADGSCTARSTASIPPRVDYSLTDRGSELVARLLPLMEWIVDNADEIVARLSGSQALIGVDRGLPERALRGSVGRVRVRD